MSTSSKALLFFSSYYEAIKGLKPMKQLEVYNAIFQYGFYGEEPNPSDSVKPLWTLIKPNLDSSIKKRDDGAKGGRKPKTSGSCNDETTGMESAYPNGNAIRASDKDKEKEIDKDIGIGVPPFRRTKKEPQTAVFPSLPSGPDRIGYAATEKLKKRQIKRIEQAAEQTTAQPPTLKEDAETAELKKAFRESTGQEQSIAPAEQPQPPPG